jgi:hypothetical protein
MPDPAAPNPHPTGPPKDPNFMAVVALAGVIVLLFFIGSWFVVRQDGRELLPRKQHDYEPYSYLRCEPPLLTQTPQFLA